MSLAEIRNVLSGQPGSNVTVSVVRARRAEPQKMVITRDLVSIPPVAEKMIEDGIGYIRVDALPKGKTQEIAGKIKSLQQSGAKKLILDLRNDSDGDESEGISTANLFLNHGTITYLQGQKYPREAFNADPAKAITTLPLAVLVNKGTAGAAEIVAAAILENARGDVVGEKTFGDGSVQKTIDLPDGSALDSVRGEILFAQRQGDSGRSGHAYVLVADARRCRWPGRRGAGDNSSPEAKPEEYAG